MKRLFADEMNRVLGKTAAKPNSSHWSAVVLAALVIALFPCRLSHAEDVVVSSDDDPQKSPKEETEEFFRTHVTRFIKKHCISCHSNRRPTEAGVNFSPALKDPGHAAFTEQWEKAVARVSAHDMPPEYEDQPSDEEREMFAQWLDKIKYLSEKDPGPFVIRRLTKTEYGNTLSDLFGVDATIADALPDEVSGEGYLNSLSSLQLETYLAIANQVLDKILPVDESIRTTAGNKILGETIAAGKDEREAARSIASRLAKRMYRRPPSDNEINVLLKVYDLANAEKLSFRQSIRLMVKGMLVSPQFLFITPAQETEPDQAIVPLDDYQLASRLSYLMWATMPDEELMALADQGELSKLETLIAQVNRLMQDSRSRALFDGFGSQWLGIGDLIDKPFDETLFPQMSVPMRRAMYDEVRLLFEQVMRDNESVARFIDSDYTFLNETLAELYGLGGSVEGPAMRRVKLDDANRGGILGMPATLAATSFPNRTSAVNRGVWVLEKVLGDHVPQAPPDVPALEVQDQQAIENLTLRQRTELHRTNPVCANCHKLLDPIGFGLENFDAIGRWRDTDHNGNPIDASGELPNGERFSSPSELKAMVSRRMDEFSRNLVERLLAYALCRKLEGYDEIVVDELMDEIAQDDYRMQTLVRAVVTSYPFTHRRVAE